MANINDNQLVDLDRIRTFFQAIQRKDYKRATIAEAHAIGSMTIELCDLAEGSTLLEDAAHARREAQWLDMPEGMSESDRIKEIIEDIDPDTILPREY
jgi:hypothetical protein